MSSLVAPLRGIDLLDIVYSHLMLRKWGTLHHNNLVLLSYRNDWKMCCTTHLVRRDDSSGGGGCIAAWCIPLEPLAVQFRISSQNKSAINHSWSIGAWNRHSQTRCMHTKFPRNEKTCLLIAYFFRDWALDFWRTGRLTVYHICGRVASYKYDFREQNLP